MMHFGTYLHAFQNFEEAQFLQYFPQKICNLNIDQKHTLFCVKASYSRSKVQRWNMNVTHMTASAESLEIKTAQWTFTFDISNKAEGLICTDTVLHFFL